MPKNQMKVLIELLLKKYRSQFYSVVTIAEMYKILNLFKLHRFHILSISRGSTHLKDRLNNIALYKSITLCMLGNLSMSCVAV